jgi:hypothetical protein
MFGAAGVTPVTERETVDFDFSSVEAAVGRYVSDFGPFVVARGMLEPQGRWDEFVRAFTDLVRRFNPGEDPAVRIRSDYWLITVER